MLLQRFGPFCLFLANLAGRAAAGGSSPDWAGWGGNIYNNRWAAGDDVTASNIKTLTRKCYLTYQYGVSATPVISGNTVYYPTWNGSFVALDYTTCSVQWMLNVTELIWDCGSLTPERARALYQVSRTSPQIDGDILFFGTQAQALVVAVNRHTGVVLDRLQINSHPLAVITISPTFWQGTLFLGTSSYEEPAPLTNPDYPCCTYIGNAAAVTFNRRSGKLALKWSVATLPPPDPDATGVGWSGAAIWGSQPSIDPIRKQVFFATGNVYSFPPAYAHCANETSEACLPQGVNQESVLAVDAESGRVNWVRRLNRMDAWNGACVTDPIDTANCPSEPPGRDADFGMAPTFVSRRTAAGLGEDVVVVAQKNAVVYALAARDGRIVYARNVSPEGQGGGISWGIAVDDQRVYYTLPYGTRNANFSVSTTIYGAADLMTGKAAWRTPATLTSNGIAFTGPTVAGDLVIYSKTGVITGDGSPNDYYNSMGALVALNKRTGEVVHEMVLDTNFWGGVAVQGRYVMFGTGYRTGVTYLGNGSLWVMKVGHHLEQHGG
ncbi:hypothetical protein MFIFM68171_06630 [Madurella fahalii]|uniref:Pyrrolo-quinoline quinone repeat domain-containing protein n=1 Tax=Madurella fahalii TaxID=1157608 RepID=A0ABQ0GFF1_9PEZI